MNTRNKHFKDRLKVFWASLAVKVFFKLETSVATVDPINYPEVSPHIVALWHAHQCVLYGRKDKSRLHVLISQSRDGQIITNAVHFIGINTVRGSKGKKGVISSTMQLLAKLEQGDSIAITVDGPRGPKQIVKEGVVGISKLSKKPIVPVVWYSDYPNFVKFKTWDEFRIAIGPCKTLALYGDPIYVPENIDKEETEAYRLLVENKMLELYEDLKKNFRTYLKQIKDEKKAKKVQ